MVVCSSIHASDYYERLRGRPRGHGDAGDAAALGQLVWLVEGLLRADGLRPRHRQGGRRELKVVQWRIGGPRDNDLDTITSGDIPTMHRALGA